jgi:prephenate dehydrogenase
VGKPRIAIIGNGVFGTFLKEVFKKHIEIEEWAQDADIIILAVPISSYEDVASCPDVQGKHLINVCSVQDKTNKICSRYSKSVTGIHPMFGPNSPKEGRSCIVTKTCKESKIVIDLFKKLGCEIVTEFHGKKMTGAIHDLIMQKTHLPVLAFGELASLIVKEAECIPDNCLPPSFKKLKALADQMKDMGEGTKESIRSNL